jgi:hypothetical protein
MSLIQLLIQLQAIDQEWDEKARLYQAAKQRLADQSELESRRQAQRHLAEGLSALRGRLRDAELELASLQQKARETGAALYGGRIRSPKELESLRQDLEHLQKRIAQLEDQVLLAMTEVDELEAATKRGEEELNAFEPRWFNERESLSKQVEAWRARLKQLQNDREHFRSALGRAELALYDDLRSKKAGLALASIQNGICQTCRVAVPSHKTQVAEAGEGLVTCDGCGRILYQR